MSLNWKHEISKLVYVKQIIADLDIHKMWPHHLPRIAAKQEDILRLQNFLGKKLPGDYLNFLRYANGWQGIYQYVDLFGVDDYVNKDLMSYTKEILSQTNLDSENIHYMLPIAVSRTDIDLFCLNIMTNEVIWFAGTEVDRFINFGELFFALIDYNRAEIDDLKNENLQ